MLARAPPARHLRVESGQRFPREILGTQKRKEEAPLAYRHPQDLAGDDCGRLETYAGRIHPTPVEIGTYVREVMLWCVRRHGVYDWAASLGARKARSDAVQLVIFVHRDFSLPDGWMNDINVTLQTVWDGIAESANGLLVGGGVCEDGKVGVEHFVRLRNGQLDAQPISGIGERRGRDSILL